MPRCGQRLAHVATRRECRAICRLAKPSSAGSRRLPFGPAADNQTSNKSVRRKGRDQGAWLWVARACFTSFRVGRQHARSAVGAVGLVDCAAQATLHGPMGRRGIELGCRRRRRRRAPRRLVRALSSAVLAPQRATTATACDARSAGHAPSSAVLPSQWATFTAACGACSVRCSQRWAFTVERSARVAEGDVRRSVRRLQRWACTVERSACVAEGDVRRSVRSTFLLGGVTYGR